MVHMVPYAGKAVFYNLLLKLSVWIYTQTNVIKILRLQNQAVKSQELADNVLVPQKRDLNKCDLIAKKCFLEDRLDK